MDSAHLASARPSSVALLAFALGMFAGLIGFWVKPLEVLDQLSWFSGFAVAFTVYAVGDDEGTFDLSVPGFRKGRWK